jgi:chlorobactene glucosyltransferase
MTPIAILLTAYVALVILSALLSLYVMGGIPVLRVGPTEFGGFPKVSIVVPVRNEEEVVGRCAESLLAQEYPRKEVIFVDGGSTDGTLEVLKSFGARLKVLEEPPLPKGWVGKNWACHTASMRAEGELLLFSDGDTIHTPWALASAVSLLGSNGLDMVTLYPRLIMGGFWERLMLPLVGYLILLQHRGRLVNRDDRRYFIGIGPFILVRREVYEAVGGHAAVRDRIDEDLRLGQRVKEAGFRLRVLRGDFAVHLRMYEGLGEMWEGWVKNIFPGLDYRLGKVAFAVGLALFYFALPALLLAAGLALWPAAGVNVFLLAGAATYSLGTAIMAPYFNQDRAHKALALLLPFAAAVFSAMALYSAYRHLSKKGVVWKGRVYRPLHDRPGG